MEFKPEWRRIMSLLLTAIMLVTLVTVAPVVFADGGDGPSTTYTTAGNLTVEKSVVNGDNERLWNFEITLTESGTRDTDTVTSDQIDGTYGGVQFTDGHATFQLKNGESITFNDLPVGMNYEVVEKDANKYGYETTFSSGEGKGTIPSMSEGSKQTAKVTVTNTGKLGELTVKKVIEGTTDDTTTDFSFTVTLSDKTINGQYGDMLFTNGVASFSLKNNKSATAKYLPENITYEVKETNLNDLTNYSKNPTWSGQTGTITNGGKAEATCTNHYITPGELKVSKTVTGIEDTSTEWHFTVTLSQKLNGEYGEMNFNDGVAEFTLKHGESKTAKEIPAGVTYTVTETDANTGGFKTSAEGDSGEIKSKETAEAKFTNHKIAPGSLTVTKTVTGAGGDTSKEWNFTVTLSDTTISEKLGDMDFENGVAEFTLKHGQSKTASGIPAGVTYTVTEAEANTDGYTTTATGDTGAIESDKEAEAKFTNDKPAPEPGSLTVTKTVTGEGGDKTRKWHFRVELSDTSINSQYGNMDFTDGVADVYLSDGESATASGLPADTTYTVTEVDANEGGYTANHSSVTGTIPAGDTANAYFENHKNPDTGSLTVSKSVSGEGNKSKEWHFTVSLDDPDINGTYGDMTFTDGVATFTLTHGQSKTADGLPAGIGYNVTETESNQGGYTTSGSNWIGTIAKDRTITAEFDNDKTIPEPRKTEVTPGAGKGVKVGDEITYEITWTNGEEDTATVTIRDPLDKGVDFVSASDAGFHDPATHTVTWTLAGKEAGATGTVTLTVRVNDDAVEQVENTAFVRTSNSPEQQTETIRNPVEPGGDPHKTETDPGDKLGVMVGQEITYQIDWVNWKAGDQTVTIIDPLDKGVDFVSASDGGTYDESNHEVTWDLGKRASEEEGFVTLTVRVNAAAMEKADRTVYNQATVTVDNDSKQTEIPENPVEPGGDPHKEEVTPGDGEMVKVGDEITYWIDWVNWTDTTLNVTITDPLDVGVGFVSASDGGTYDEGSHTVTWNLGDKAPGDNGSVTLVVKVNANAPAKEDKTVYNQATVTVGNESKQTEIPQNPVEDAGSLKVTKILVGDKADPNKDWTFTVTLSDTTINGTYGGMTFVNGVATFTLKGGESLTATGLPVGITYTVTEAEANQDGYLTTATGDVGEIVAGETAEAVFTNAYNLGDLTVTKIIEGKDADPNKDWTFTVTLSDTTINGTYGGMTFTNGVATFTLKGGESLTATGLPAGITYTVTEAEANTDGYTTSSIGAEGTIPAGGEAEATFVNVKGYVETGSFAIRKRVRGEGADLNQEFRFIITLSDPTINGTYGGVTFVNGVGEVTLKDGEHVWVTYLPVGVTYTVTEAEANQDGYETVIEGAVGEIVKDGTAEVKFTNYKGPGEPDEDEPWDELPDPPVPLAPPPENPPDNPPQTNDPVIIGAWLTMNGAAAIGLVANVFPKKKKDEDL